MTEFGRKICKVSPKSMIQLTENVQSMMSIGQLLRAMRVQRNWKQHYVAKQIGISQTTLSRIENNRQVLTEKEIQKLAEIFEVNSNNLTANALLEIRKLDKGVNLGVKEMAEVMQQLMSTLNDINQHIERMQNQYRADFKLLKEENRQLRQRDEKWMQMLVEMQTQLVGFLSKNKA
jgi:transcriptional regulator with XRE-family HTH domain